MNDRQYAAERGLRIPFGRSYRGRNLPDTEAYHGIAAVPNARALFKPAALAGLSCRPRLTTTLSSLLPVPRRPIFSGQ
jgi:hypothetical protein